MVSKWKKTCKKKGTNPDWVYQQIRAIEHELKKDNPDLNYLLEKIRFMQIFCSNPGNFYFHRDGLPIRN